MQYAIKIEGVVEPQALQGALSEFDIPADLVLIGPYDPESGRGVPVAMLTIGAEGQGFGSVLYGDTDLAEATHLSQLALARFLAPRLGIRCLVDDGTKQPNRWILVAQDGSYGKVFTDEEAAEEGDLRIVSATEPIAGAPELPVVPEPDWAR